MCVCKEIDIYACIVSNIYTHFYSFTINIINDDQCLTLKPLVIWIGNSNHKMLKMR